MLHELLLALVGCTGDFIIDGREEEQSTASSQSLDEVAEECTFKLAPDLTFLQNSEREILERLLRLGFFYRELDRFAVKSRNLSWITCANHDFQIQDPVVMKGKKRPSVYRRALANGISEVLSIYRSAVLQVEQNFLADPVPVLASVTQGLNKFEVLLPPLHSFILEVEREDVRGGRLLNLLHKKCHCGVPELQACMQRLLWHGHQVMYRQLAAWMVYGILQDQHEEFFISRQHGGDSDAVDKSTEDAHLADWHTGFHVSLEMKPDYIQMQVAESILFVGKAIRVLRNPSPSFRSQDLGSHQQGSKTSNKMSATTGGFPLQKDSLLAVKPLNDTKLLPQSEADKIAAMLQELKDLPEFHKRSFEYAVDSIRTIAAAHLWQLVVVHADLNGHLKALKDYFLLAKGDFFQCFLEESRSLMRLPPRPGSAETDLKVPFQQAAVKTIGDDDRYFSRVSLRMPLLESVTSTSKGDISKLRASGDGNSISLSNIYGNSTAGASLDGWDGIALEYSVDWPLQLLFTREVLAKYCKVFQYLIRLKRIQLELEKSWAEAMQQDHADSALERKDRTNRLVSQQRRQQRMPMWRVRQHMTYLITNLQFYIQVDVIESQWNLLQERVETSKDFTELTKYHQEYLSALISQSFLDIGSVSRILDSIIKLCLQLCRLIEQYEGNPNTAELEQITEEFNKKSNSLYTILRSSKLAGSQRAPFLRQFLLRLNYNSFFEATARGALNVVRPRPSLSAGH
ncbi:gamma-tubulin complex component 4 [Cryptomeria japonica]|uniref:gamma-tubulin complex component 4 n=1 Tax=Cryptomeria japonica TaxID=3369 RepID=UPI0027DA9E04|nr:gamma-tubulin complex component 4 [Cryptomeria japonica]